MYADQETETSNLAATKCVVRRYRSVVGGDDAGDAESGQHSGVSYEVLYSLGRVLGSERIGPDP